MSGVSAVKTHRFLRLKTAECVTRFVHMLFVHFVVVVIVVVVVVCFSSLINVSLRSDIKKKKKNCTYSGSSL